MTGWLVPILGQLVGTVTSLTNNLTGTVNGILDEIPGVEAPALLAPAAGRDSTNAALDAVSKNLKELNTKLEEIRDALIEAGIMEPE